MAIVKIFKNFAKIFFLFVGSIIILLALLIGYPYVRGRLPDSYYLKNTTFLYDNLILTKDEYRNGGINRLDNFKEYPFFGVSFHRLKRSESGVTLILRFYRPNPFLVLDADAYTKISISLASLKNETIDLSSRNDIRAVFTTGGSAWPRNSCFAEIRNGTLKIELIDEKIVMKLKGSVDCGKSRHGIVDIDETRELTELQFSELTPWLGSVGNHPYDETMKR